MRSASCSTANGAILGTAAVAARNVAGVQLEENAQGKCRLLRATRITLIPVVTIAVLFALRVPETGILLTLAFDVMLAALAFPFIFGHYWSRASTAAASLLVFVGVALVRRPTPLVASGEVSLELQPAPLELAEPDKVADPA